MIVRFCLYSIFKNLRFADPFLILFLRHLEYPFLEIGSVLGFQHLVTGILELPLGVLADRWGRRRSLAAGFLFYAVSFAVFARLGSAQPIPLVAAVALYAVAEALRTGSHKAIILDYLARRNESSRATRVIGVARSFSKASSATAALAGGLILYHERAYESLFWLSIGPALAGFLLMLSYPRELDGEMRRDREHGDSRRTPWRDIRRLLARPGAFSLLFESVLFESQVKIILKYYLQPFLGQGLASFGIPVLGNGAVWIGVTEFARDQLGAASALASGRVERLVRGQRRALRYAYTALVLAAVGIGAASRALALLPGIGLLMAITMLQNLRRPIFVSAFDQVMDGRTRATSLSLESLARTLTVAGLLPLTGWCADRFGLWSVFGVICAVLLLGRPVVAMLAGSRERLP